MSAPIFSVRSVVVAIAGYFSAVLMVSASLIPFASTETDPLSLKDAVKRATRASRTSSSWANARESERERGWEGEGFSVAGGWAFVGTLGCMQVSSVECGCLDGLFLSVLRGETEDITGMDMDMDRWLGREVMVGLI